MCGIAGVLGPPGRDAGARRATLEMMAGCLAHRGPDASGTWEDGPVGLAHRRLAVLGLGEAGAQPMVSASGRYVIVYNGEVYNHPALRAELERSGRAPVWRGSSDTETLLAGIEALAPEGSVKLGFRAHYAQLETKLTVRGRDDAEIRERLAPIDAAVRQRLGNFILAEDDETLEGVVLAALRNRSGTLATVESFTGGAIAGRIAHLPGAETVFRSGIIARDPAHLLQLLDLEAGGAGGGEAAALAAGAARRRSDASHGLAVLIDLDEGDDRIEFGGTIHIAIATADGTATRRARILGGREWVRLGAVEMGLDCLRRHLAGLPVTERIDFEKT